MDKTKVIIVGKTYESEGSINGPIGVIKALIDEFSKLNINYEFVKYDEDDKSRASFFFKLLENILFNRNCIINVHTDGLVIALIVLLLSKLNRFNRYFLTVHGVYAIEIEYKNIRPSKLRILIERLIYKNFPNIICVSDKLKEDIIKYFKRTKEIYVINNGMYIINQEFKEKQIMDEVRLIMTGGIRARKGIFETIELVEYLRDKFQNLKFSLDIYGAYQTTEILDKFKLYVKEANLGNIISYKGIIKERLELLKKYNQADINICLSLYDTFNISVIESMTVGTPTITSSACGAARLINNYNDGFVVNMDDDYKNEISNIIKNYIMNNDKYTIIRKNAYNNSKNFSWETVAHNYLNLFFQQS